MLNKFNSNSKRLTKIYSKVNLNNILDLASVTESMQRIIDDGITAPKKFNSNTKHIGATQNIINTNNLLDLASVTESLQQIINDGIETPKPFNSNVKQNENPIKLVSTKNIIEEFHLDILKYSARYIQKSINEIVKVSIGDDESTLKKLIIYNVLLDYGTEQPGPENFEVLIDGLHLPGIFIVNQNGSNIEIILTENWVIDDRVLASDIKVFGKIKEL